MNSTQIKTPSPVEALEKVLLDQLELYEKYAELLKRDAEYMTRLRIDQLEQSNKMKNTLLLKVQTMDRARQNLIQQIAKNFNIAAENVRIGDICKAVGGQTSKRLAQIRERLHAVINSLKSLQDKTHLLASSSLAWMNGSINALRGLLTPSGTYNNHGKVDRPGIFSGRTVEKQV